MAWSLYSLSVPVRLHMSMDNSLVENQVLTWTGQMIIAIGSRTWETSKLFQIIREEFVEEMCFGLNQRGCAILT